MKTVKESSRKTDWYPLSKKVDDALATECTLATTASDEVEIIKVSASDPNVVNQPLSQVVPGSFQPLKPAEDVDE